MSGALTPFSDMDGLALDQLLALAGPITAAELLHRLHSDLVAVSDALTPAWAGPDWAVLRVQSHVLIGIAGTIGAAALHRVAGLVNALGHLGQDVGHAAALPQLQGEMTDHLAKVIADVAHRRQTLAGVP